MVIKEMEVIFVGVLMAMLLVVANGMHLSYQTEDFTNVVSGNSVKETINGLYDASSVNHRISILFQFLLLVIVIVIIFIIVRKLGSKTNLSKGNFIGKGNAKYKTDLDTLYEILKREKEINVDDIGKVFKVNSEIALEWSKVLENGELAIIDYPRFGKPVLRLLGKNNENNVVAGVDIKNQKDVKNEKEKKIQVKSERDVVADKKVEVAEAVPKKKATKEKIKKTSKKKKKSSKNVPKHSKKLGEKPKKKKR